MKQILKFIFAGLFLLSSIALSAQRKVAVATPILKGDNLDVFYSETLLSALEQVAVKGNVWKIVARGSVIDALLKDFDFEASGLLTDADKAMLATLPNVDCLCVSVITQGNGRLFVNTKLVDKATGEYKRMVTRTVSFREDFYEVCQGIAFDLFDNKDADSVMSQISEIKK